MLRAKQLGTVEFLQNTLFIKEEYENDSVSGSMVMSAAGTHIVYESAILTPYITLDSHQYGWITEPQRAELVNMWEQLDATFTLTYDDDTTEIVRFARENQLVITPLYEGSCEYTAVIPLAKIEE